MSKLLVSRIGSHDLPLPARATDGSAGYDLRAREAGIIYPGEQFKVATGFAWAIPEGWCGQVWPRSGHALHSRIDRRAGLIDSDFRGEVSVVLVNEGEDPFEFDAGDRIAQLVLLPFFPAPLKEVDTLPDTARVGGFGHTGAR